MLVQIIRGVMVIKRLLTRFVFLGARAFCWLGRAVLLPIAVRLYRLVQAIRRKLLPAERKLALTFTHRSILHVVLAGITVTTAGGSLYAQAETITPSAKTSVLYQYMTDDGTQLVEETGAPGQSGAPGQYLADTIDTSGTDTGESQGIDYISDTSLETEGADAPTDVADLPVPADTTPSNRKEIIEYTVESGDTLIGIAQKFGISIATILWQNNLSVRDFIKPGQKLSILSVTGVAYKVKSGDSVQKIASTYNAKVEDIISWNDLGNGGTIHAGETLVLPNGRMPETVAVAPAKPKTTPKPSSILTAPITVPKDAADTGDTDLLWPVISKRITQYYGVWERGVGVHTGIDMGDKVGNPLYAADDGIVTHAGCGRSCKTGYGYYIDIDHGNGMMTRYGHSSKILVKVGEQVHRGQVIGLVGSTGFSTGPHIHFEVRLKGKPTNPLPYIR